MLLMALSTVGFPVMMVPPEKCEEPTQTHRPAAASSANEDDDGEEECAICLERIRGSNMGEPGRLACGHAFHERCFASWVAEAQASGYDPACPCCRQASDGDEVMAKMVRMAQPIFVRKRRCRGAAATDGNEQQRFPVETHEIPWIPYSFGVGGDDDDDDDRPGPNSNAGLWRGTCASWAIVAMCASLRLALFGQL